MSGEKLRLAPDIHRRTEVKHPSGAAAGSFSGHSTDHTVTKAAAAPSDKRKFQEDNNFDGRYQALMEPKSSVASAEQLGQDAGILSRDEYEEAGECTAEKPPMQKPPLYQRDVSPLVVPERTQSVSNYAAH